MATHLQNSVSGDETAFVCWSGMRVLSAITVMLAGAALASCALAPSSGSRSSEYFSEKEYGVAASPRVVAPGKPIPKGGGRYHVGQPYKVKGKVYRPRENPNYSAVGLASWYGSAFHGRSTANGEIYDLGELTAAHPTLPLPSYVRVTNLANDRSVVVRVNDRGPFEKGRVIDLSATAAEMLDFRRAGTAKVKVDYVGPARMDGLDRQMLIASYRGPKDVGHDTLFASNVTAMPKGVAVASLSRPPQSKRRTDPTDRSIDLFGAQRVDAPRVTAPAFLPGSPINDDPLGPLILRAGFTTSYAPTDHFSPAHVAAAELANRGKSTEVVQIGTFAEKTTAERVAARFVAFGEPMIEEVTEVGRTLYVVRILLDAAGKIPRSVVAAAVAAGTTDAFVLPY